MTAIVCHGDARSLPFPDDSIDLVVTSPPYFGLRSYTDGGEHYAAQIGAEPTPREFIAALVECTREMARVLKPSGSIFVNLGDKYAGGGGQWANDERPDPGRRRAVSGKISTGGKTYGSRAKSLLLIPERYRIACTDELGLIARAVLVWSKPNGLPESVRDRVRRSHEDWVHLTKSPRYFEAVDEIRESYDRYRPGGMPNGTAKIAAERRSVNVDYGGDRPEQNPLGKLPGSVWTIATQPLRVPAELDVDHFAAFPMEWPRRLITGWCPREVCTACGAGRHPVSSARGGQPDTSRRQGREALRRAEAAGLTRAHIAAITDTGIVDTGHETRTDTVEGLAAEAKAALGAYWREFAHGAPTITGYACVCPDTSATSTPGVVLDPFGGTGTTALVADVLGRVGISLDASEDYGRIARWRTTDERERATAAGHDRSAVVAPSDAAPSLFDLGSAS